MDFTEKKSVPNPRATANVFSKIFFWWMFPLFQRGVKENLTTDDLYDVLKEDESQKLGRQLAEAWNKECFRAKKKSRRPKFYRALFKTYWKPYLLLGCWHMLNEWVIRVSQTVFLQRLIAAVADESCSVLDQYLYATGIVVTTLVSTLILHPTVFEICHLGMKCRVACSSLVYRKALKLSKSAENQTTVGQLVNLLSNDVGRFDNNLLFLHYLFVGPIQGALFMYLLWTIGNLNLACLSGAGFIFLLMPIQYYIGKLTVVFRFEISERTDIRAQIMNEIIVAMRVIKQYAWEFPFSALVNQIRKLEVKHLRRTALLRGLYMALYTSGSKLISFAIILTVFLQGGELRSDQVFFMLMVTNLLQLMMVWFVPTAASHVGELFVSLNRIEAFLILDEKEPLKIPEILAISNGEKPTIIHPEPSIKMANVSASWTKSRQTLKNLTLNLQGDKIVMIIGPVGSGKTSFLHTLISELPVSEGKLHTNGQLSYASQEPWIFSGDLRQNILFGRPFDDSRYRDVIHASALEQDLKQLPYGQDTIVGERGVSLSGGQKARVNLARALYQDAEIILLDDPLSAVDSTVSRHIFEKCVTTFLKGKLRILVTHQLQYLPQADHIIVLNAGDILAQGSYAQLVEQGIDFVSLMASETEEDSKRKNSVVNTKREELSQGSHDREDGEKPHMEAEKLIGGSVTGKTYWDYFRSGGSYFGMFMLAFGSILTQILYSGTDYWLSYWTNTARKEREKCEEIYNVTREGSCYDIEITDEDDLCANTLDSDLYFYIFTGLVFAFFAATSARTIYTFQYCLNVSINLHNKMFSNLIRAPTKFFDDNPSGRILNRFTKDLGNMDELLPPAFFDALVIFLQTVGILVVVIISNYFVIIPAIILLYVLVRIRQFFISTSRHVKRIEAITRSPVYTHVVATIQGLTTIRALGAETILIKQFDGLQDLHSSAWYIFLATNRWFGIWLEMITQIFLTVVIYSFLLLINWFGSAQVGLAISSILGLTGSFQWGMRQSAETENHMISVQRCLEYSNIPSEAPLDSAPDKNPPSDWPMAGTIQFKDVSLSYNDDESFVLKNLSFDIKSREKIGIVGRTGAGKSSIIACLFRMTEPKGQIFVDDLCINDLGLHDLRKNISIIPQDPVLFSGSVRYNLDPFDQFEDDQLWKVIQEVELKDAISALDFQVADGGNNFSVGQRQLVCLARAILRRNRIIVMDEATANVDPRTDNFIQKTIRKSFQDCTIITIAHRLHSVIDCDRILVLDAGQIKEYDHPHKLLQDPQGILNLMVSHTGKASSLILHRIAAETYSGRRGSFQAVNLEQLSCPQE